MKAREEIHDQNETLIAWVVRADQLWTGAPLNFLSDSNDFIQAGTWTHPEGTILPAHIHNVFSRESMRTQEVVYVVSGSLLVKLYDDSENFIQEMVLNCGDLLVCLSGGHGYTICDKGTRIIEVKNGPYFGADIDRRRI